MANQEIWTDLDGVKVGKLKDWLLNPLTTAERNELGNSLSTTHSGLPVFDKDVGTLFVWNGSYWVSSSAGTASYTHTQSIPSAVWTINHGLGYRAGGVTVIDSSGRTIISNISYDSLDVNLIILTFGGALSGVAYIS